MSYVCMLTNGWRMSIDVIFEKSSSSINIQMTLPDEAWGQYLHHALTMIANLE